MRCAFRQRAVKAPRFRRAAVKVQEPRQRIRPVGRQVLPIVTPCDDGHDGVAAFGRAGLYPKDRV